jgi:hypothetical protein
MVAEMGQHLIERLPPGSVAPFGEVTARLAGPDPADADVLASLALLWPGYFAVPFPPRRCRSRRRCGPVWRATREPSTSYSTR